MHEQRCRDFFFFFFFFFFPKKQLRVVALE
jgi:hypothetical protein